ncbi:MAG: starch-binding protein [Bacteroidales bacterium]|nr:starch-binding protein [Bacteroidales bacterium]
MKKILSYLTIPVLAALAASCMQKEPIEFSHEKQAFQTQAGKILVEAILPQATTQDEEVYIIGPFNGEDAAIGNPSYRMTRSETITSKWGVYLDPSTFQGGKTLADGFTFYSVQQGYERSSRNEAVSHTLTIGTGEWANVYADKWEAYFLPPKEDPGVVLPEHSGVRVYIIDQTGWDAIALYQWGDVNNFGGDWPGMQVSGTVNIGGQDFKYFEYGDDIIGLGQNLIFNNNGNGVQLADYNISFADGVADYFLLVTADGVSEAPNPVEGGSTDPRKAMTETSPWGVIGSIASTGNSWGADEPMFTDGTWHVALALELTASDEFKFRKDADWGVNFGGTCEAIGEAFAVTQDGSNIKVPEDGTYDLFLNPDAALVVIVKAGDPVTLPSGGEPSGPDDPEVVVPNDPVTIYVQDLSGWDALYVYMWGDKNDLSGGWPGAEITGSRKIGSVTYKSVVVEDALGRNENLIFNNNAGTQTADYNITLTEEVFVQLDAEGNVTPLDPYNPDIKILVNNKTDWKEITLYAWGDAEAFGGWPGATPVGKEVVGDVEYTVFGLPAEMAGKNLNLIFNNNGGGQQLADFAITVPEDELFLNINAQYSVGTVEGNPRGADKKRVAIFVDNQTTWDSIALYQWGEVNNLGGGWPGAAAGGVVTIGETIYLVYFFEDALGLNQHLIFNNGGGGVQLPDFDLKFEKNEYFLTVTDEGVTLQENPETVVVFVQDQTGWDEMALYMWGDVNNLGGGWPGVAIGGTALVNDIPTFAFVIDEALGKAENLIFNNNGNGTQLPDYALKFERNAYYLTVKDSGIATF